MLVTQDSLLEWAVIPLEFIKVRSFIYILNGPKLVYFKFV